MNYTYILCALLSVEVVQGAIVVEYLFDGSDGSEDAFAPSRVLEGVTSSAMVRGSGVSARAGSEAFAGGTWTTASELDASDYFSFTLAPDVGTSMTLTQFDFDERRSGSGPTAWTLKTSVDSFTESVFTFSIPDTADTRSHTVVLSTSFENISGAVEFRLFGHGAESSSGTWRIDNVSITGTVVPEPWEYGMVCAVVCGAVWWKRRKNMICSRLNAI